MIASRETSRGTRSNARTQIEPVAAIARRTQSSKTIRFTSGDHGRSGDGNGGSRCDNPSPNIHFLSDTPDRSGQSASRTRTRPILSFL